MRWPSVGLVGGEQRTGEGCVEAKATLSGPKASYRLVVSKVTNAKAGTVSPLATGKTAKASGTFRDSLTVAAKRNDRLVALIQKKQGSTWAYVASAVVRAK